MRILMINKYVRVTGGADVHCMELATLLRRAGHEVRFLSTACGENVEHDGFFVSCRVTNETRNRLRARHRASVAVRSFWNQEAAAAMSSVVEGFRPDVVHAHKLYPQLSVAPIVVAASKGIPIVQTIHDHEFIAANPVDDLRRRIDWLEDRFSYRALNTANQLVRRLVHRRLVSEWIAVSDYIATLIAEKGIAVHVLPNFIHPTARPLAAVDDRDGIAFLGRFRPEKGVRDVIALAQARPHVRVVVGGAGVLSPDIEVAARDLPNLEYVGLLSPNEVSSILASVRVCVMPSRWNEAGPLTPLQAMAVGTPIVAYDAGGLREYVSDGGFVVRALDELIAACDALVENSELWKSVSKKALNRIARDHDPLRYANRINEVYRIALANSNRANGAARPINT
jgi:glycosyltransferase involved in cell wall biosynthesis